MSKPNKEQKKVSIGGQAVLEGVMMRGRTAQATCVRDADGVIRTETKRITPPEKRNFLLKLPIVRGVFSLVQSLFGGTAILMRSAEVYGEGEPSKFERWISNKFKIDLMTVVGTFSMILGLVLAVFLFMWLPQTVRVLFEDLFSTKFNVWAVNFIEGGLKLAIFVVYILLTSLLKDIKRTYMYHGAEHKTITCYEKGMELTVENAKKCKRVHDRCGTTFTVFVLLISIIVFAVFESLLASNGVQLHRAVRILIKIAFLPIVAGVSYELLKFLSKTQCPMFYPLKVPGLLIQKLTTKEPDEKMLEVAICAFNKVLEMDRDPSIKEQKFIVPLKRKDLTEKVKIQLREAGIDEEAEAEWIVSLILNVKRDEVYSEETVSCKKIEEIEKIVNERLSNRPLWYCIGDTEFYGYKIKVDERCLIPRPETEILVEKAISCIKKESKVLDLCTGSGAIAVVINKQTGALVVATDISDGALEIAKENAQLNQAEVEFIKSDMFLSLEDRKFDVIVSNPPYIRSCDIKGLQKEVKDFEPLSALDGGEDGLEFYRIISMNARKHLNDGGVILLEVGYDQAESVAKLFTNYSRIEIIKDYENINRIVKVVF